MKTTKEVKPFSQTWGNVHNQEEIIKYVLLYTFENGGVGYYNSNSTNNENWVTNSIFNAEKYKTEHDAGDALEIHKNLIKDAFGWENVKIEIKEVIISVKLA